MPLFQFVINYSKILSTQWNTTRLSISSPNLSNELDIHCIRQIYTGHLLKQYLFQCKSLQYRVFIMANNMQWIKSIHLKMYVSNINNHDRYIKRMRKTINDLSMWLVYVIGFTSIKFVALSIRSFSMVYWLGVATCYNLPSQYSWYKSTRNFKITCVLSDKYYVKWFIKRFRSIHRIT